MSRTTLPVRAIPIHRASLQVALAVVLGALLAAFAHQAVAAAATPLLPNLVADPPDNVSLATDSSTGTTRLLLRFNGYIHNIGPGALDFRGSREKPKVSKATEEQVERAREKQEGLPQKTEEELASPPMKVFQRLFTTKVGEEETNIERAHVDESSSGEILYVSADGHHHWHLQRAAKYSLWNAAKTAEVDPAQKVGFCLDDSQHVETSIGPSKAVYADSVAPFRDFCQQYRPNATSLFEGVSPGWRDVYDSSLAFQWVDASNVLPGEYWLREDVNPLGTVKETGGANTPSYSTSATIIPGFDALAQSTSTPSGQARTVTLTSKAWSDGATPKYTIVSQPQHGTLGAVNKNQVLYTPTAGYTGPDSFTFSAADPSSQFPSSPAIATVAIEVTEPSTQPGVTIEGAPGSMTAGTSVQLSAHVVNDSPTVTWSASAGSITTAGLYTAPSEPPAGGTVVVSATSSKGAKDQRTIEITAVSSKGLLAGDASTAYSFGDQTTNGREEAFQFTAKATGTVEELQFRTNATANTGVTGLSLGIFAESAGKPGEVLGKATVSGQPATSSWIKASGLSVAVVSGTKYWLVVLPVGESGKKLHFNAAVSSGGTGNVESITGGLSVLTPEASWEAFNQGPAGFQAIGAEAAAKPGVTIEGAPGSMTAGTSVQLSAHVVNDSPTVTWSASAGSITTAGLYTAPSEPPAGGTVVVSATSSKGAKDQRTIEITAVSSKGLLAGDASTAYSFGDQTTNGREEAFQFTAKATGTVEELQFRTNATANTGVTGLSLGIFAESAGKPGEVLGKATVSGQPATSSWIKASGLSVAVVSGTKYWLVVLPVGESGKKLHFNAAVSSGGTGNVESITGGLSVLTPEASWEAFNQGPAGFQAIGLISGAASSGAVVRPTGASAAVAQGPVSSAPQPSVMIDGAPAKISAGTSVQFQALVANDDPAVTWTTSAGSITATGLYTAPRELPAGSAAVVRARSAKGAQDQRRITIVPVAAPQPAPAAPLPPAQETVPSTLGQGDQSASVVRRAVSPPEVMLVGNQLVMTSSVGESGRVSLSAYHGRHRLGGCTLETPANRSFTCRLSFAGLSPRASISTRLSLSAGGKLLESRRAAAPVPEMRMPVAGPPLHHGYGSSSWQFVCGPAMSASAPLS
jgi:hypothetical protein